MNQRGFATLEVILMVMVIGILASIAVPKFNDVTTKANTAKIQADLSSIDTAISLYYMEHGEYPTTGDNLSALDDYLRGASDIKPPSSGKAYIGGEAKTFESKYSIEQVGKDTRAVCGTGNTAEKFYLPGSSSTSGSSNDSDTTNG